MLEKLKSLVSAIVTFFKNLWNKFFGKSEETTVEETDVVKEVSETVEESVEAKETENVENTKKKTVKVSTRKSKSTSKAKAGK